MAVLTQEQEMLKNAALSWTQSQAPIGVFRTLRDSRSVKGFDPELYAEMAEMGWTAVVIPEEYGGADFGFLSLGLVAEQLGRNLTPSPVISTAAGGASALLLGGRDDQKRIWLNKIATGNATAALAIDEGLRHDPSRCGLRAVRDGGGWRLSGEKRPVLFGIGADFAIVSAKTSEEIGDPTGITLFLVRTDAEGLSREPLIEIDVRGAAIYDFQNVYLEEDAVLGDVDEGGELLDQILDRVRAVASAEMLGSAGQSFEVTIDYLKTRTQFGQTIGSFQALQHRAAAVLGELEMARSAVEAALIAIDENDPCLPELASLAKAMSGEAFKLTASEMIQMHGGIGMTDEHDAGLYYKRARAADQAYGSASFHRERFGGLVGY